jgi:Putative MetA-pathway of phenol degradation
LGATDYYRGRISGLTAVPHGLGTIAFVGVVWAMPAAAQQSPSVSDTADRPGFADSPVLLGRGHFQIESGVTFEREGHDPGTTSTFTWPQAELHAGVSSRLDVSVTWDGLVSTTTPSSASSVEERTTGGADVRIGAKLGLVKRPNVDMALIGYFDLPVGERLGFERIRRPARTPGMGSLRIGSHRGFGDGRSGRRP